MKLYFPASRNAIDQVTSLFNFVWPTAAALWNLRWQVQGFIAEVPDVTVEQLKQRFLFGSNIDTVDLKQTVTQYKWEDQTAVFASFVLTNAFAIYEQWADEILQSLGQSAGSGKKLQFPDHPNKPGVESAIASICASESPKIRNSFYGIFSANKKYSMQNLHSLMLCYRYFKEIRNAQIHSGGIASQSAFNAYMAFLPVSDKNSLGRKGDLAFDPVVLNESVSLNLRGVVGFTDVLIKIIVTIDAELCRSIHAERVFEESYRAAHRRAMLSANKQKRDMQVSKRCIGAGFPAPLDAADMYEFLLERRLIVV